MIRFRERLFNFFILLCLSLAVFPLAALAEDKMNADGQFEDEVQPPEGGFDHSYVNPIPPADMHVWDKSLPLPEVFQKLSDPAYLYFGPELEPGQTTGAFPLPLNDYVRAYVNFFSGQARGTYASWLRRSGLYRDMILGEINRRGMPVELLYLCMIESGFSPKITSWAGARGLWQFIPGTGRRYNLEINYWVDERCDPEKSTRAALDYLNDNYKLFGDWHRAAAAYNTGEGRVLDKSRKYGTDNYWDLVEYRALARETMDYVPKMIAAAIIGAHPEQYGFYNVQFLPPMRYATVTVDNAVDLRVIADCAGTTPKEIAWLNPELIQFCTPPGSRGYQVHIPPGRTNEFRRVYAMLKPDEKTTFKTHTVQRGESIRSIAAGYLTSAKQLAAMNGLSKDSQVREGQVLIVPVPKDRSYDPSRQPPPEVVPEKEVASEDSGYSGRETVRHWTERGEETGPPTYTPRTSTRRKYSHDESSAQSRKKATPPKKKRYYYTLRPGETLWEISRRTGIPVDDLKRWNKITDPTTLQYGDTIVIYAPGAAPKDKSGKSGPKSPPGKTKTPTAKGPTRTVNFTVRKGDSCYYIARYYGIQRQDIIKKNHLDSDCTIKPGQKLALVVPKDAPKGAPPVGKDAPAKKTTASRSPAKASPGSKSSPAASAARPSAKQPKGSRKMSYTVKSGDSLWQIARYYDVHVAEILAWNGLASESSIRPGQSLKIYVAPGWKPGRSSNTASSATDKPSGNSDRGNKKGKKVTYKVKSGDSLWSIAKNHDVHTSAIMAWNKMKSEHVSPGQTLVIYPGSSYDPDPKSVKSEPKPKGKDTGNKDTKTAPKGKKVSYTVKEGDTLSGIAGKYGVSTSDLKQWNNLSSPNLKPGQKLVIYKSK